MKKSIFAIALVGAIYIASFFYYGMWERIQILYGGDSSGYYLYLPASFIHHDIEHLRYTTFARETEAGLATDSSSNREIGETYIFKGRPIIKYTCGIAILESPAFFVAHYAAPLLGYKQNGYTKVYLFCILFWNVLFSLMGLFILRITLRTFFSDNVTAMVLFLIGCGTNLFYFSSYNTGMSHGYLFTLYALLLLYTIRFFTNYSVSSGIFLGLSAGLITLVRPNEVYCILVPMLYGVTSPLQLVEKIKTVFSKTAFYVAVVTALICVLPQIIYWYSLTGHFVFYSYGAEAFDFRHPKIIDGLFGFKNGWYAYTPVMLFASLGIVIMLLRSNKFLLAILSILPLHIYIIYSWWCWVYMGGLGSRPMIELYPLMAIPLGYFIAAIVPFWFGRIWVAAMLLVLPLQQAMFNYQKWKNIMWSEDATTTFYWQTFFKTKMDINDVIVYDTNEKQPSNPKFSHLIWQQGFCNKSNGDSLPCYFILNRKSVQTPAFELSLKECKAQPGDWIKASFECANFLPAAELYQGAKIGVEFMHKDKMMKSRSIRIQNKLVSDGIYGIWRSDYPVSGEVYFFTCVPAQAVETDMIKVYAYNYSITEVGIKSMKVELWKE